jgi:hypothetical protein
MSNIDKAVLEQLVLEMKEAIKMSKSDPDIAHNIADDILIKALLSVGADELVAAFEEVEKWYA